MTLKEDKNYLFNLDEIFYIYWLQDGEYGDKNISFEISHTPPVNRSWGMHKKISRDSVKSGLNYKGKGYLRVGHSVW